MKSLMTTVVAAAILACVAITPAMALEKGGVKVGGKVDINVKMENLVGIGIGKDVKVGQSIGTIHGGADIKGDVKTTVNMKNMVGIAIGKGVKVCQQVGSIGDNPACY